MPPLRVQVRGIIYIFSTLIPTYPFVGFFISSALVPAGGRGPGTIRASGTAGRPFPVALIYCCPLLLLALAVSGWRIPNLSYPDGNTNLQFVGFSRPLFSECPLGLYSAADLPFAAVLPGGLFLSLFSWSLWRPCPHRLWRTPELSTRPWPAFAPYHTVPQLILATSLFSILGVPWPVPRRWPSLSREQYFNLLTSAWKWTGWSWADHCRYGVAASGLSPGVCRLSPALVLGVPVLELSLCRLLLAQPPGDQFFGLLGWVKEPAAPGQRPGRGGGKDRPGKEENSLPMLFLLSCPFLC